MTLPTKNMIALALKEIPDAYGPGATIGQIRGNISGHNTRMRWHANNRSKLSKLIKDGIANGKLMKGANKMRYKLVMMPSGARPKAAVAKHSKPPSAKPTKTKKLPPKTTVKETSPTPALSPLPLVLSPLGPCVPDIPEVSSLDGFGVLGGLESPPPFNLDGDDGILAPTMENDDQNMDNDEQKTDDPVIIDSRISDFACCALPESSHHQCLRMADVFTVMLNLTQWVAELKIDDSLAKEGKRFTLYGKAAALLKRLGYAQYYSRHQLPQVIVKEILRNFS